jgi:hypothetical protein
VARLHDDAWRFLSLLHSRKMAGASRLCLLHAMAEGRRIDAAVVGAVERFGCCLLHRVQQDEHEVL